MKIVHSVFVVFCLVLLLAQASAQNNAVLWSSVGGGVARAGGANNVVLSVTGQTVAGVSTGASFMIKSGFLANPQLLGPVTSIGGTGGNTPLAYSLQQNYPNPFNPSTTIAFELPVASQVSLTIYDMLGRVVSVLVNEREGAGVHEVKFDGINLASGVYFYRLQAGSFVQTKKLVLTK
jgi:hypothetical protein